MGHLHDAATSWSLHVASKDLVGLDHDGPDYPECLQIHTFRRSCEGKLLESFGMEGKSVVMLTDEAKYEDGVVMEVVVEKFVKYFSTILHHNQNYFANFVMCECLNFILIFFNFWATDQFLQGKVDTLPSTTLFDLTFDRSISILWLGSDRLLSDDQSREGGIGQSILCHFS